MIELFCECRQSMRIEVTYTNLRNGMHPTDWVIAKRPSNQSSVVDCTQRLSEVLSDGINIDIHRDNSIAFQKRFNLIERRPPVQLTDRRKSNSNCDKFLTKAKVNKTEMANWTEIDLGMASLSEAKRAGLNYFDRQQAVVKDDVTNGFLLRFSFDLIGPAVDCVELIIKIWMIANPTFDTKRMSPVGSCAISTVRFDLRYASHSKSLLFRSIRYVFMLRMLMLSHWQIVCDGSILFFSWWATASVLLRFYWFCVIYERHADRRRW